MFGIGIGEIVLIVVAVLIFVRPRDLPRFLRKLGMFYRKTIEQLNAAKMIVKEMENELDTTQTTTEANGRATSETEE